ncbi:MAG: hypothetical protein GX455_13320, partial [Phycisphaerae bacterium]|nr:hypothetical protein [Phycisphaerae bacterium]
MILSVNPGQSIQAAIDAAADGDQIEVAPGTYTGTMDFKGKAVRLYSTGGPEVTTIDGLPDYLENFDDGNFDGWQIVDEGNWNAPSAWSVVDGVMVQGSNIYTEPKSDERYLGTYALSPKSFDWDFYSISLTVKSDDNDAMGVMFCYQDAANYYRFSMDSERKFRRLVKCVNGVFSTLYEDSVAYVIGQSYRIRIDPGLYGTGLFVDDVFLSNVSDTTFQGGPIALYCWGNSGTYFDDVRVQPHWTSPYNIVQCVSGETADTVLEGFTVTQSAWGFVPTALFLQDSSPTIRNCIFRDCDSQAGGSMATGGGILNRNGNLTVFGCTFINNIPHIDSEDGTVQISDGSFSGWNGSIQLRNSDTTIARCSFEIGGIAANDSDIVVSDCSFSSCNWPLHSYNCNLGVTNCTFSFGEYGAITNDYCSAVVTNCTFA